MEDQKRSMEEFIMGNTITQQTSATTQREREKERMKETKKENKKQTNQKHTHTHKQKFCSS